MLSAPEPLADHHKVASFDCGVSSLNDWLKRRVRPSEVSGASRTYVVCDGLEVLGYYALAASAVALATAPGRVRRNMPDPVPVVILARLAVANSHQGRGLGRALFQDAARRIVNAAEAIGIRGMLVHALGEGAKAFYIGLGLEESPLEPMTLMCTVADLGAAIESGQ